MIPIKPVLIAAILLFAVLYFAKLRSRLWDRMLVLLFVAVSVGFIVSPDFTTSIAHRLGVGRGADLLFYFSLIGFSFIFLLLFSWIRELQQQVTSLARELALHAADPERRAWNENGDQIP
jgi:hypothetical protein